MLKNFLKFIFSWRNKNIQDALSSPQIRKTDEQAIHQISQASINNSSKIDSVNSKPAITNELKLRDLLPYLHGFMDSHLANRLSNALIQENDHCNVGCMSLSDYLNDKNSIRLLLANPNIGETTSKAFDSFVKDLVNNKINGLTINDINDNCESLDKSNELSNLTHSIWDLLSKILDEKERFILIKRSKRKTTLEDLGNKLQVTRERIRQIEAKAIKKLILRYRNALQTFAAKLDDLLDDSFGQISIEDCKNALNINKSDLYLLTFVSEQFLKEKIFVTEDVVCRRESKENFTEWNTEIDNSLFSMKWPPDILLLRSQLDEIPYSYLEHYLNTKRKAQIKNNKVIHIGKLPRTSLVSYALRDENRPMTPNEVAMKTKKMFGVEMSGHSISAVMGRMDNVLIVARGLYALYESLKVPQEIIDEIREESYDFLYQTQSFVSSKVLYEDLFKEKYFKFSMMNDYVILGILQDDNRFITKRGLMVGLVDFEHETKHKPLKDEISEIVEEQGPVKVSEIQQKLSQSRRILAVTITLMLENDERFIRCESNTYASVKYVFEETREYELFKLAIQIILLNEPSGIYYLKKRLERIRRFSRVLINQAMLQSILRRIDNLTKRHEVYKLNTSNWNLKNYNQIILEQIKNISTIGQIKEKVLKINGTQDVVDYLSIDYRLQSDNIANDNQPNKKSGELISILDAFGN